jgi:hypothetical protein
MSARCPGMRVRPGENRKIKVWEDGENSYLLPVLSLSFCRRRVSKILYHLPLHLRRVDHGDSVPSMVGTR